VGSTDVTVVVRPPVQQVYLNDVEEGGRTVFSDLNDGEAMKELCARVDTLRGSPPNAPLNAQSVSPAFASAASSTLGIKPRAGMAVIHFPTTTPDYLCLKDTSTMHAGEAAVSNKYIAQQYVAAIDD
jgi:hypothetical protein